MSQGRGVMRAKTLALSITVIAGMVIGLALAKADDDSESRIRRGFAIAPVKLNLVEKNKALVGLALERRTRCK
jgi:hypothetical protein